MSNDLKVLADNRDALLLAEIGAWLHMFGKFHEDFLNGKSSLASEIPKAVQDNFIQLDTLLKDPWVGSIWKQLPLGGSGTEKLTLAQLIRTHQETMEKYTEGFRRLLIDAHGRGSGIEKGLLDRFAISHKDPVYLATSLGYEEPIGTIDIQKARMELYSFLEKKLGELKTKNADISLEEWKLFRDKFILIIKEYFCITVAETRRSFNDVTLLDQTAISVAFFKAALAQNLLLGKWRDPSQQKVEDKYHWRLLRIGLDGLTFWGDSIRIGDLVARKKYIDDALNKVQTLLEVVYPLGFEIYRDENGSIFIVPDIDHLLTYTKGSQPLEELIQTIAEEILSGETRFTLSLSSSTRDALLFGKLATKSLPWPTAQLTWLKQQWIGQERDICPVCGLRPQGPSKKALSRKVCDICEERRSDRSKEWIKNPSTTIWIDEVADVHGQLALLIANFDIADWLSGSAFNTILAFDPKSGILSDKKQKPPKLQNYNFDLRTLIRNIQDGLQSDQKFEDNLLGYLVLDNRRGGSDIVQDFYDLHVTQTDLEAISSAPKPELLALSLIRQSPSFARIYRTWETTKKFWKDIESTFENTVGKIGTRLRIQGNFIPNPGKPSTLGVSHAYELKLDNVNLSVVCSMEGEFVTVDNLYRTAVLYSGGKKLDR